MSVLAAPAAPFGTGVGGQPETTLGPGVSGVSPTGKWVTLHQGLDIYVEGDVLDDFQACGGYAVGRDGLPLLDKDGQPVPKIGDGAPRRRNLARLCQLGAIRPANSFEATQTHVTLPDTRGRVDPVLEQRLAEQEEALTGLRRQNQELQNQLLVFQGMARPLPPTNADAKAAERIDTLEKERDATANYNKQLNERLNAMEVELLAMQQKADAGGKRGK